MLVLIYKNNLDHLLTTISTFLLINYRFIKTQSIDSVCNCLMFAIV